MADFKIIVTRLDLKSLAYAFKDIKHVLFSDTPFLFTCLEFLPLVFLFLQLSVVLIPGNR